MDYLFKNVTVVTMDEAQPLLQDAFVGVADGKITLVSRSEPRIRAAQEIDGRGKILLPGFVNAHSHVSMAVMRGFADDYALQEWLHEHVFPTEAKLDAESIRIGAQLGIAEMIRTGTVSITDMYMKIPAVAQAAYDAGIYANISNGALSFDPEGYDFEKDNVTAEMREMLARWHGADDGRIRLDASIHAEYTSFEKVWRANAAFAAEHGLNMHVHLSETESEHRQCVEKYGKTPAQVLAAAGVFDTRTTAAHCVYVTEEDMALMAEKHVTAVHNPVSNLKLSSGVAPVPQLLRSGVNVALGTDGVCSNNNHDLFEEIKLAAILHKGTLRDPSAVPALQALTMATRAGAFAQGREDQLGQIKAGFDASVILVDAQQIHLQPVHNPVSTLVYSAHGSDVCMTMVRGKILYENGNYFTIDLERVRQELNTYVMPRVFGA